MAYDLVILAMMATAVAGILHAQRETAKNGVRYIAQTRVPDRSVEHSTQSPIQLVSPDSHTCSVGTDSSEENPPSINGWRAYPVADKWVASIKVAETRIPEKYVVRIGRVKYVARIGGIEKMHQEMLADQRSMEEERLRLQQQLFAAQRIEAMSGVASDFNDLLTVMFGSASLARHRLAPEDPLQESMRIIEQSAQRAADLARRLVGFARPGPEQITAATNDLRETVVKQEKILEYHGLTFDSMELRLRRLELKAAQRRERTTEEEPESDEVSPSSIN